MSHLTKSKKCEKEFYCKAPSGNNNKCQQGIKLQVSSLLSQGIRLSLSQNFPFTLFCNECKLIHTYSFKSIANNLTSYYKSNMNVSREKKGRESNKWNSSKDLKNAHSNNNNAQATDKSYLLVNRNNNKDSSDEDEDEDDDDDDSDSDNDKENANHLSADKANLLKELTKLLTEREDLHALLSQENTDKVSILQELGHMIGEKIFLEKQLHKSISRIKQLARTVNLRNQQLRKQRKMSSEMMRKRAATFVHYGSRLINGIKKRDAAIQKLVEKLQVLKKEYEKAGEDNDALTCSLEKLLNDHNTLKNMFTKLRDEKLSLEEKAKCPSERCCFEGSPDMCKCQQMLMKNLTQITGSNYNNFANQATAMENIKRKYKQQIQDLKLHGWKMQTHIEELEKALSTCATERENLRSRLERAVAMEQEASSTVNKLEGKLQAVEGKHRNKNNTSIESCRHLKEGVPVQNYHSKKNCCCGSNQNGVCGTNQNGVCGTNQNGFCGNNQNGVCEANNGFSKGQEYDVSIAFSMAEEIKRLEDQCKELVQVINNQNQRIEAVNNQNESKIQGLEKIHTQERSLKEDTIQQCGQRIVELEHALLHEQQDLRILKQEFEAAHLKFKEKEKKLKQQMKDLKAQQCDYYNALDAIQVLQSRERELENRITQEIEASQNWKIKLGEMQLMYASLQNTLQEEKEKGNAFSDELTRSNEEFERQKMILQERIWDNDRCRGSRLNMNSQNSGEMMTDCPFCCDPHSIYHPQNHVISACPSCESLVPIHPQATCVLNSQPHLHGCCANDILPQFESFSSLNNVGGNSGPIYGYSVERDQFPTQSRVPPIDQFPPEFPRPAKPPHPLRKSRRRITKSNSLPDIAPKVKFQNLQPQGLHEIFKSKDDLSEPRLKKTNFGHQDAFETPPRASTVQRKSNVRKVKGRKMKNVNSFDEWQMNMANTENSNVSRFRESKGMPKYLYGSVCNSYLLPGMNPGEDCNVETNITYY